VIVLDGFVDGQCGSQPVTATATFSDTHLTTTTFKIDGADANPSGTTITANGTHTVVATANDGAGNHTGPVSQTFTIDTTAPSITISGVTDGEVTNQNVTPVITFSNNATSPTVTLNNVPFVSGTTITAENDYHLIASASTCAGRPGMQEVDFAIDRTPPVITVSGVANGQTYDHAVSPTFSATDLHQPSVSATLDGASYVSSTTINTNGTHTLVISAHDAANNPAQQPVTFTLAIPSGTVGTTREAANGRILIALESTNGTPAEPTFLETTLTNAGYRYVVKNTRAAWLSALRSDQYGIVILYRTMSFNQDDYKEVNEAVTYGDGVIYIGENPNLDYMKEAWGAYKSGDLDPATPVTLANNLASGTISVAAASGTHAFGKLVMAGGTVGGTVVINNVTQTVATTHAVGLGHAVLLDWNAELSTSQALADLYLRAVAYVQPTPSDLVPGGAADVHFPVTAGSSSSFVLSLTLDPLLVVDAADPSLSSNSPPTWNFSATSGQTKVFTAVLGLPDQSGVFNVTSTLKAQTSTGLQTVGTSSLDLSIPRSRAQFLADVKSELSALSLSGSDVGLRTDALNHLNQVSDLTNPTQAQAIAAIAQILTAINDTRQITTANVTTVRIDEARLLRAWETRAQ
jgi:hypothetical protein